MQIIADLHLHSKYSRATSKNLDLLNLEKYARIKGISLLGTGDFCHPKWIEEIKHELRQQDNGLLTSKSGFPFLLTNEISLIYTQGDKGRRIHLILLAPNLDIVDQITSYLKTKGRIDYDGRPIFKIPCDEFTERMKGISNDIEVIPAHAWTPWFSMFGSKSGFDSVKECFGSQAKHIHAIETGLSSDPPMNWRLSQLDNLAIVSFSDAHSFWPWRLGREATLFDTDLSYNPIIKSLRTQQGLIGTIEVDPNYGKYHFDGHRNCNVALHPQETLKQKGICPVCRKPLTIGVLYRVEELADRPEGYTPKAPKKFHSLVPLSELLSAALQSPVAGKKVWQEYNRLLDGRSELDILLNLVEEELKKIADRKIVDVILKNRRGEIKIKPGYDGVYGIPLLEGIKIEDAAKPKGPQKGLDEFYNEG